MIMYLMNSYSPVNRTGSPQWLFATSNFTGVEYNTKHAHFTNVKHQNNPKVSPFGIALVKKWQIKLGHASTSDRFVLAFQYQIKKEKEKRVDKCNRKLKILYQCIKDNTSAIWQQMLYTPPTKTLIS